MNPAFHRLKWPLFLILGLWCVLVLPAVFFADWFTLDMPYLLWDGMHFPGNLLHILSPYEGGGRYDPFYFIYNFAQVRIFGIHIADYYIVQTGMFLITSVLTCLLFYKITLNVGLTTLLAVAFYLSTPNTENMYTIGKAEPIAYFFIIILLWLCYRLTQTARPSIRTYIGIMLLFVLALISKETSLVVAGLFPTAMVAYYVGTRWQILRADGKFYFTRYCALFVTLLGGLALARLPYLLFTKPAVIDNSYVEYKINFRLIRENFYFYLGEQPDIFFFGLMATVFILLIAKKLKSRSIQFDAREESNLVFTLGMVAVGWAYIVGMLFWRWPMGYYLYLPSLFFRVGALYGLHIIIREHVFTRRKLRLTFGLIGMFLLYGLLYWYYVATSQVDYSRMYGEALHKYIAVAKPENRLVIESYQFYAEQRGNTPLALGLITGDNKYKVDGISDIVDPAVNTPEMMELLHVTPEKIDANEVNLPSKGDYLLVMTGNKLATWFLRGVTPYFNEDSILKKENAYDMELVAEDKAYAHSVFVNVWTARVNAHPTYVGYKLYRITSARPKIVWRYRYSDGWMGKRATLKLFPEYADKVRVMVSTPPFLSPNHLTIFQDDVKIQDLTLVAGQEYHFDVVRNKNHVPNLFRFEVDKTVVPKKIRFNRDKRVLGILISIAPVPKDAHAPDAKAQ